MRVPTIRLSTADPIGMIGHAPGRSPAQVMVVAGIPGRDGAIVSPRTAELGKLYAVDVVRRLRRATATAKAGEVVAIDVDGPEGGLEQLLVVGVGAGSPAHHRRAGAAVARRVRGRERVAVGITIASEPDQLRAFVEGLLLGSYGFSLASTPPPQPPAEFVLLIGHAKAGRAALNRAVRQGRATAQAVALARDLANTRSDLKDPAWMVARSREVAQSSGLAVRVRTERGLRTAGFGGLLAVGGGSARPPALVQLEHVPDGGSTSRPHVVLVGKGITFDSGGLSLKPADAMTTMHTDMAGSAAVLGVMSALKELRVPVRVTALLALAENMPSGSAYRPGDVVTQYGGRTVEIRNTDAEGRIVLADALAYADARLDPDVVIDVATLTGAASVGLGRRHGALYASDPALEGELVEAAADAGELLWAMPLVEEYRASLDSDVADLVHISTGEKVGAGSITAALFLREFTGGRRWAHLDIAGPGRSDADSYEVSRGATGYGTRLLIRWLEGLGARS